MGIELGDVLDPVEYEKVREERRRHVMQIKRARNCKERARAHGPKKAARAEDVYTT